MKVPFVDLKAQYLTIKSEVDHAISSVFESGTFIGGKYVREFEQAFCNMYEIPYCVGLGNGTDALFVILKSLGIGTGDEVITPSLSWISTSETITLTGAQPVFADIDPDFYTLTPGAIQSKITKKTRAIVAVHLYGQAAPAKEIMELSKRSNLHLIEDCSQAHLTEENETFVGKFGSASAFSFYPTKNLGAYGDAGCVITENAELATNIRRFANHGGLNKDEHRIEGMNSRLDPLQAAVLSVKLSHLPDWTNKRIGHAVHYNALLKDIHEVTLPVIRTNTKHTFHLYVIRVKNRNKLKTYLEQQGIQTMIHYPCSLPFEPAYRYMNHRPEDFPVAYRLTQEILSLPVYPELVPEQVEFVCDKIKEFYRRQ